MAKTSAAARLGGLDSDCRQFPEGARDGQPDDRLCARRRRHSFSQREIRSRELPQGHQKLDSGDLSPGQRKVMEHHGSPVFYQDLLLLLGTAGVVIPLFRRLRISPVIGYLIAGIPIGPYGIGRLAGNSSWPAAFSISDIESIAFVGELGVVMLLFMIGLELSPARLYTLRRLVF